MTQLYQQNPAAETAPLGQGLVVLEPKSRKFCALNATSSLIWSRLQEPATLEQLEKHISEHYQCVSEEDVLGDVRAIIEEMTSLSIVLLIK